MKEQDLIQALGSLPQDLLDELDEWQKSGAPLTGAEPETDAPARTVKPVITQRRNQTMKQKTEKSPARLRAWTAGIAAAVVLCTAVAVPVGREAVRRAQQNDAGFAESEPDEPVTEVSANTWIVPDGCTFFHWEDKSDLAGYYDCLPADTKLYAFLDELGEEQPPLETGRLKPGNIRHFVYGEDDEVYDIYFIGLPMQEVPDNLEDLALITGTLTQSGKLHLQIGALTDAEQAVRYFETEKRQYAQPNTAFVFAVPEGALPEITEVSTSYDEIPLEPFLTDAPEAESERLEWFVHLVEQNSWLITANGEPGIRLIADEPAEETLTADADPQPDTVPENLVPLLEELISFGGDDTESPTVPDKGTAKVLRSMNDLQPLIDETDRGYMEMEAAEWYSQFGINEELFETNDVLYFAFKDLQLPENYYNFECTGGSITAADSLTLNFSAFILDDPPVDFIRHFNTCSNYYYFYTIPKDSLSEIGNTQVKFAETHYAEELPDNVLTAWNDSMVNPDASEHSGLHSLKEYLDSTQEYPAWVNSIPEQPCITWESAE